MDLIDRYEQKLGNGETLNEQQWEQYKILKEERRERERARERRAILEIQVELERVKLDVEKKNLGGECHCKMENVNNIYVAEVARLRHQLDSTTTLSVNLLGDPTTALADYFDNASVMSVSELIPDPDQELNWNGEWESYCVPKSSIMEKDKTIGNALIKGIQSIWNEHFIKHKIGHWTFTDTHNGWQKFTVDCVMHLKDTPLCEMGIGLVIELVGQNEEGWPSKAHKSKFVRDLIRLHNRVRRPVYGVVLDLGRAVCFRLSGMEEGGIPNLSKTPVQSGGDVRTLMTRIVSLQPRDLGVGSVEFNFSDDGRLVYPKRILGSGAQGVVYQADGEDGDIFIKQVHTREHYDTETSVLKCLSQIKGVPQLLRRDDEKLAFAAIPVGRRITLFRQNLQIPKFAAFLTETLKCAHEKGVVHRDVRPSNLAVAKDNHPVLLDFGCACRTGEEIAYSGSVHYAAEDVLIQLRNRIHVVEYHPWFDLESLVYSMWDLKHELLLDVALFDKNDAVYDRVCDWWISERKENEKLRQLVSMARASDYDRLADRGTWMMLLA